jgi:hypothetical protein
MLIVTGCNRIADSALRRSGAPVATWRISRSKNAPWRRSRGHGGQDRLSAKKGERVVMDELHTHWERRHRHPSDSVGDVRLDPKVTCVTVRSRLTTEANPDRAMGDELNSP